MRLSVSQQRILTGLVVAAILAVAFALRLHNLFAYKTVWADDGGAHMQYVMVLLDDGRLPRPEESYLAWHEPLFYIFVAGWHRLGALVGLSGLNWWETINVVISFGFLAACWSLAAALGAPRSVRILVLGLFAVLFGSVKLAAYLNNELLAQTLIVLLTALFVRWRLGAPRAALMCIAAFAGLLGIALLTKVTALIVLIAALMVWSFQWMRTRHPGFLRAVALTVLIVSVIQAPWLAYKWWTFGTLYSINLFETKPRQELLTSDAWRYLGAVNTRIFTDSPYWSSDPPSAASILLADTFGDYYNLFNNPDRIAALPPAERIQTGNGRFVTPLLWQTMLRANRIGVVIAVIWLIGFVGYLAHLARRRRIDPGEAFVLLMLVGGWAALLYNNLRLPYLERGVLKAHFIYYTYPLLVTLAYLWWRRALRSPWAFAAVCGAPIVVYAIAAWPMLWVA